SVQGCEPAALRPAQEGAGVPITLSLVDESTIRIDAGPRDTPRLQQIPGARAHVREGYWTIPASLYLVKILRRLFQADMDYGDDIAKWAYLQRDAEDVRRNPPLLPDDSLYAFQKFGAGRLTVQGGAILADKPGLGK